MPQILDKNSLELVVNEAELLHTQATIEQQIQLMSQEISQILEQEFPICLTVMLGGLLFSAQLVMRLQFPLELDYIHASRYGEHTQGGNLQWQKKPKLCLEGRKILIMDDILDEGITLQAIIDYCYQAGADKVYTAVLVDKIRSRTGLKQADFVGLQVPDRYVFGYGMDYKGHLRHLTSIYAVKGL